MLHEGNIIMILIHNLTILHKVSKKLRYIVQCGYATSIQEIVKTQDTTQLRYDKKKLHVYIERERA
jgi:hypothetical protein